MQHNTYNATQHSSAAQHKARAAELRVPIQDILASAVTQCFNCDCGGSDVDGGKQLVAVMEMVQIDARV